MKSIAKKRRMNKIDYQKKLEQVLETVNREKRMKLLLHSCCAPCSSYVLEYLSTFFDITVFYYNPNIMQETEYRKRVVEQQRLIKEMMQKDKLSLSFVEGSYEPELFLETIRGLEDCKEGGARCEKCFMLRLEKSAAYAVAHGFDYYTTTLTISPMKNAAMLNEIGTNLGKQYQIPFLPSDFKKRGGYQRSIELSKLYDLYRQNYCGCDFSKPKDSMTDMQ